MSSVPQSLFLSLSFFKSMVLYMSVDGGRSFNNVTMPTAEGNLTIQSLQVHPVKDEVSILAYSTSNNVSNNIEKYIKMLIELLSDSLFLL